MPKQAPSHIKSSMTSTADDAKKIIISHLDAKSLSTLDQVKIFHSFTQNDGVWKKLVIKEFSVHPKLRENESYKRYYQRAYPLYLKLNKALADAKTEKNVFTLLLEEVIENGYELLAPKLIDRVDVNAKLSHRKQNNTFLHIAAALGELEILTLLLAKKSNVNAIDYGFVIVFGSRSIHSMTNGVHVDAMGSKPLARAAENGHTQCMALLIQNKAQVNHQNSATGESALHCAARAGQLEAVNILLKSQARVDLKDKHGNLALEYARNNDHPECATVIERRMETLGLPIPKESTCTLQ